MEKQICPNNFNGEREHKWSWCSVSSFNGGRSGTYAKCTYCQAEDWAKLEYLKTEMPPPVFQPGDAVVYREEKWRYDIAGMVKLDLVKTTNYPAIVQKSWADAGWFANLEKPLEWRYSILCKDQDGKLFERSPLADDLVKDAHGGTIEEWQAQAPKPKPYKLEDDDPVLTNPRLRSIGVRFEKHTDSYRCGQCNKMQPEGTPLAYVSDNFSSGDSWRDMVESYQRSCHNGHSSGRCPACCHELLPKWSKEYLTFKGTGKFPMIVYMQSTCDGCNKDTRGSYYYRSTGEDQWDVFCRECQYARQSHDLYEGGFSYCMGSSSSYAGTLNPGESATVSL